jgi:hypothetical protein
MKFNVTETTFVNDSTNDKEVEIHLHVFADGDVGLFANEEAILYLTRNGHIILANLYPDKYKEMGFEIDNNHVKVTK